MFNMCATFTLRAPSSCGIRFRTAASSCRHTSSLSLSTTSFVLRSCCWWLCLSFISSFLCGQLSSFLLRNSFSPASPLEVRAQLFPSQAGGSKAGLSPRPFRDKPCARPSEIPEFLSSLHEVQLVRDASRATTTSTSSVQPSGSFTAAKEEFLQSAPWTESPCIEEAATLHLISHVVLTSKSVLGAEQQAINSGAMNATTSTSWATASSFAGAPLELLAVLKHASWDSLGQFFVALSCLFPTDQILALRGHPLDEVDRRRRGGSRPTTPAADSREAPARSSSDYFLFRDWVANHLYHAIIPPLADAVHYLARERHREPIMTGPAVRIHVSSSSSSSSRASTTPTTACAGLSKTMGYLVVALGMQGVQPVAETLAVVEAAEQALRPCVQEADTFSELVFDKVDPLLWSLIATLFVRLGKTQGHSCMHWSKALPETERRAHLRAAQELDDRVPERQRDQAAASTVGPRNTARVDTTTSEIPQKQLIDEQAPRTAASPVPARDAAAAAAAAQLEFSAQQVEPQALERFGVLELPVGVRENCFTKQGNHIWAGYEDNLQKCLGGRSVLQFFLYDAEARRMRPVQRSAGGHYAVAPRKTVLHQTAAPGPGSAFGAGGGNLIIWHRTTEFGRPRLLVRDPRFLTRSDLYVSLAEPPIVPALIVEHTSAGDAWNREWLESYLQAIGELGFPPLTFATAQDATNHIAASESAARQTDVVAFWRINQMYRGGAAAGAAGLQGTADLGESLRQFTQSFEDVNVGYAAAAGGGSETKSRVSMHVFPRPATAALYQNKLVMLEAFLRHGINVPPFRVVQRKDVEGGDEGLFAQTNAGRWPKFPVLLKHAYAASSRGLAQCESEAGVFGCLRRWFAGHPDQVVVIVQEKLSFLREFRATFIGGEIVHSYWRLKESTADLAASTHISNSTLSFAPLDEALRHGLQELVTTISADIMEVGALDGVVVQENSRPVVYLFEVSPIFDMNPEPETAELRAIPYSAYKKTEHYTARRLQGYVAFCKQFVSYALEVVARQKRTLYVDIDNTLNHAYRRFQMAESDHRGGGVVVDPFDADLVRQDEPIAGAAAALQRIRNHGGFLKEGINLFSWTCPRLWEWEPWIVYLTARVFEGAVAATHEWLFHRGHGFPSGQVVFTSTANEKIAFLAGSGVSVNLAQAEADAGAALAAGTSIVSSGGTGASPGGERGGGAGEGNSINNFGSLVDLDDNLHAAADNFSVASSSPRNAVEPFLDRILIDDLTRAHHKQRFELQEKLLTMLARYQVPFIMFNTLQGTRHWEQIERFLLALPPL